MMSRDHERLSRDPNMLRAKYRQQKQILAQVIQSQKQTVISDAGFQACK